MKIKRKQHWVDAETQGAVVKRVILFWATCMLFITFPLLLLATIADPGKLFFGHLGPLMERFWPMYLMLVLLLPLAIIDAIRETNKIAGPIYNLKRHLTDVVAGKDVRPLKFRDDDYWQEVAVLVEKALAMKAGQNVPQSTAVDQPAETELVEA